MIGLEGNAIQMPGVGGCSWPREMIVAEAILAVYNISIATTWLSSAIGIASASLR